MRYTGLLLALSLMFVDVHTTCQYKGDGDAFLYYVCNEVIPIKTKEITKEATISCSGTTLNCTDAFDLNFGRGKTVKLITIENCYLNSSIQCVMKNLNATGVETLKFTTRLSPINEDTMEGMEMVENLEIYNTENLKTVPKVLLKQGLRTLILSNNGITDLSSSPFLAATNLSYLKLSLNNISTIPANAFKGLENLKKLHLYKNEIRNIDVNAFKDLKSLENLYIDVNEISDLPAALLQTPQLKLLAMELNSVSLRLRSGLFANLLHLEEVIIRSYGLTVEAGLLSKLPSLRNVELRECALTNLPEDLFRNSNNITTLLLNKNNISALPVTIFAGLEKVEKLDLSENQLITLTRYIFEPLENLKEINLDRNLIEKLPERLFSTSPKLLHVSIAGNHLQTIDEETFFGASSIKSLNISYNELFWSCETKSLQGGSVIVEEPSPLKRLKGLENLDLSHNHLKNICSDWMHVMIQLKEFNMSYNYLTEITNEDVNFHSPKINIVDLRNNSITKVNLTHENKNPFLGKIKLDNNPFICDCQLYDFLRHPKNLKYMDNAYCYQPITLRNISLKSIQMGYHTVNTTVSLSNLTCPLPNKENCSCIVRPANKGTECICHGILNKPLIPNPANSGLDFSMHLTLTSTDGLEALPDFVKYLNLSNLKLKTIPNLPKTVTHINLSHNKLKRVPEAFLRRNLRMELRDNPFECGCFSTKDVENLQHYHNSIDDYEDLLCYDGGHVYKKDVKSLCDVYSSAVIGGSLAFFGLLIAVFGITIYKYSLHIKLYFFRHGWTWLIKEEMLDANKQYQIFLSYYHGDEEYVTKTLLPELDQYYNVCVHTRDFEIGEDILTQIYRTVANSQRTLIVFSRAFLESKWCLEEFRAAYHQTLIDRRNRVVVILREDVDVETVPEDIKFYLGLNTYIKSNDSKFWERLMPALPKKLDIEDLKKKEITELAVKNLSGLNVIYNEEGKLQSVPAFKEHDIIV